MDEQIWKIIEADNYWAGAPAAGLRRDITEGILEYMGRPEAIYLYGPRRAGKTTVCLQLIEKLSKKHGKAACIYVNFEEPAYSRMLNTEFLSWIIEKHSSVCKGKLRFVFFDEIQNVDGWEKFVRMAVDRKDLKIILTGSSAKLLSSEFASSLGGRGLGFRVLPFSFREFLRARKRGGLKDFLEIGGYPEVVLEKSAEKRRKLLLEYFETAIIRDIASRYQVRDVPTLRNLAIYVITNSGKNFSYNKIRAMTGLSFDTIKLYLSYIEEALLAFQVPFFSYSLKKALEKPRKYYAYDTGLQAAISKSFSPDYGRRAENAVAIELIRRNKEVQYYSEKTEVDFVIKEGMDVSAMNVTFSGDAAGREEKGLGEFSRDFKIKKSVLLMGEEQIARWLLDNLE
ncbi:MAG: ATP-binding protein [Candidatus Micrarchaeota archaeon]